MRYKLILLTIFFFFSCVIAIRAQDPAAYQDLTGYKIFYKGKEISAAQADSLKKVLKSFSINTNSITKEAILSEGRMLLNPRLEQIRKLDEERTKMAGSKAIPPFAARDLANNLVSTEVLKGKIYVLNFWFIACKPCIMEMPDLNALVKKYKGKDVEFIALALDDAEAVKQFLDKTAFDYTQIPNAKPIIMKDLQIHIFPTHMIVDKQNNVSYYTSGYSPRTGAVLDQKIGKLLKGK